MTGNNTTRRFDLVLIVLLLLGLPSALMLAFGRYELETANRHVELTLDYLEVQNLSVSSGTPVPELLTRFKGAGVSGVAISEDLLGDLASTGQATYTVRASALGPLTVIYLSDAALWERVSKALSSRLPDRYLAYDTELLPAEFRLQKSRAFVVRAAPATLNLIGLGPSPNSVKLVRDAGLDVVARLQNHPALTTKGIDAAISDMREDGITRLISAADEVLGYRGLIPYAAKKITGAGLVFGSIEFAKQRGDARMCKELGAQFIRVHSVPVAEMGTMSPGQIIERFARAVKERDIRLCYVRLPATSGENPLHDNLVFVSAIRAEVEQSGYRMGPAEPFGTRVRPLPMLILIALSVAAGGILLLQSLFDMSLPVRYGLLVIGFVLAAGLAAGAEIGRQIVALLSALIFPTLAITAVIGRYFSSEPNEKSPLPKTIAMFVGISLITLCGAVFIVGLLADRSYMVKVNQFMGIKAAHLLPILFVILIMAAGLPILGKPFAEVRREMSENIRRVVNHPLFVWHAIAVVVGMGIIGVALMRTGNDAGVGVSGIELKFRAILDRLLVVRPRTKEFLIGHPALFLGIALLLTRRRAWGLPLVALGVLGQVSLLNTFCHIHTPLAVSILRAVNGLIIGLLVGVAAWLIFGRPRLDRPAKK